MVDKLLDAVLSTSGLVSALLFGALVWQTLQLERVRRSNDERAGEEARARVAAFTKVAESFSRLEVIMTQIAERMAR